MPAMPTDEAPANGSPTNVNPPKPKSAYDHLLKHSKKAISANSGQGDDPQDTEPYAVVARKLKAKAK